MFFFQDFVDRVRMIFCKHPAGFTFLCNINTENIIHLTSQENHSKWECPMCGKIVYAEYEGSPREVQRKP